MKILQFKSRGAVETWNLAKLDPPWGERPSIFEHVFSHLLHGKPGFRDGGERLPDDVEVFGDSQVRWTAGSIDGVTAHHFAEEGSSEDSERILEHLKAFLREGSQGEFDRLYAELTETAALGYIDALLESLRAEAKVDAKRLYELAFWLATEAADREPVKVALAILGILGSEDIELFSILGRHDEFTLYAAASIVNSCPSPEEALWDLAKLVDGWGRIHLVEQLASTSHPGIRAWMLREGYRNQVLYEYLAHTCAKAGALHEALDQEGVDEALLGGAGDLLRTLLDGLEGAGPDMDEYEEGARSTELYLGHIKNRESAIEHLQVLAALRRYLADPEADWNARMARGWSREVCSAMVASIEEILERPDWPAKVAAGLESPDAPRFAAAAEVAELVGLDPWDHYFERLRQGENYWYQAMQTERRERALKVVRLAEETLPLEEIASGPGEELGLGVGALDFILQDLHRFPGCGWKLIKAGMMSPVVRNRHLAIRVLGSWDRETWPEEARFLVHRSRSREPNKQVREAFAELLKGNAVEDRSPPS